ncbi:MAG: hypothetical protein FJ253_12105, partial [Phycisphaerae bacterium]|nr:hypothetical protein [Phycisphaerae bacterium]
MALLIVLGALLVVAVAAATVAHSASIEITRRRVDVETAMAEDLADAAIAPLLAWLRDHSESAAVHSDSPSPAVKVMDERVMPSNAGASAMVPCRIEINVWDQHGMVPISLIGKPGALANTLPEDVVESMRSVKLPRGAIAGLDLLALGVSSLDSPGA